jgi:hypothetical protein
MFSPVISDACGGQFLYQSDVHCFATVFASCFSMLGQLYTFFFQSCTCVLTLYVDGFVPISWSDSDSCELWDVDVSMSSSIKLSANTCLTEVLCILFITMSMFMVFHFQCQVESKYFHQLSLLQLISVYHHLLFPQIPFCPAFAFWLLWNNKKPMHRNHTIITGAAKGNAINI